MKIKILDFSGGGLSLPLRAHYNDAGADVYCPKDIFIGAGKTEAIALGFGLKIPDGFMGLVYPRSGMAREGIVCELPPIDSGYRGEIHAVVTNLTDEAVLLQEGIRIGQLVVQPVVLADFVTELGEEREEGAFGSTGE